MARLQGWMIESVEQHPDSKEWMLTLEISDGTYITMVGAKPVSIDNEADYEAYHRKVFALNE